METLAFNPDAIWISHSAIEEFYRCPKSYYFRYLYTNSDGLRITLAEPNLTLGVLVDESIKYYLRKNGNLTLPDLLWFLDFKWKLKSGKSGGFTTPEQELAYKNKGKRLLTTFFENYKSLNLKGEIPQFLQMKMVGEGDIRLCGSPDLYDHLADGTIHIIDFKTSEKEAVEVNLQLPIYKILVENALGKKVSKTSFWYLNVSNTPVEVQLEDKDYLEDINFKTQAILKAREQNSFNCLKGEDGCLKCRDYEAVKNGLGIVVGNDKKRVVYFVDKAKQNIPTPENLYSNDLPF